MERLDYVPDWAKRAVIYHIYPLGFFDAPQYSKDDDQTVDRLAGIRDYYDHFQTLGIDVIQFGPLFESVSHGYDTTDYMRIDHRLGTNDLFREIVSELHEMGIRVILDGVFNHVGREFDSFLDVRSHGRESWRKHWHFIDFSDNKGNPYHDGFDYENWEGHYELVKLNLQDQDVKDYLFSAATYWLEEIGIDGWRLDVAYLIDPGFWRDFRRVCKAAKPDCFLVGEMIHGLYTNWIGPDMLDAGTGYQVYKSIWSAFNSKNMHELKSVLERSFHHEWGLFKDVALVNFLGNHDTTRIRSLLNDERYLLPAFLLLFTLNGIPKIYYGDEIGTSGEKTGHSDQEVRRKMPPPGSPWPASGKAIFTDVVNFINLRRANHAFVYGDLTPVYADDHILAYLRQSSQQTILTVINTAFEQQQTTIPLWNLNLDGARFVELLEQGSEKEYFVRNNQLHIPELYPCWGRLLLLA